MTLHDYTVKSCDAIYIEDIPCILHPNIAYRYLEYTGMQNRIFQEWDFPSGYKAYADQYRHFHINHPFMAYRSALNDIKSGKIILLKSLHGGKEIFSVQTRSGNLCTDLPLNLDSRLRYLIDNKISKPVYVSSSRQPKQYAQAAKTINSKAAGRLLAAGGIYNGNLEGYSRTAEQLGGDAPAGFQQVMDNKGIIIAGASVASGLMLGRLGNPSELAELSKFSKIPDFKPTKIYGFTTKDGFLINAEHAVIDPKKMNAYALNAEHPTGGHKAIKMQSALGYNPTNSDILASKVREGLKSSKALILNSDVHGQRMAVEMPILGVNGDTAIVRTGWVYETDASIPRLTTIYVK
ncbi:TPA: DUF6883 domain-containing protein [Pluralibacter gergoviae]